nr:hypothetical protein [Lacrimispora indolis]
MAVRNINDLKGGGSGPADEVHVATGWTAAGVVAKSNKFKVAASRAGIHGSTKGRITVVNHFFKLVNIDILLSMAGYVYWKKGKVV